MITQTYTPQIMANCVSGAVEWFPAKLIPTNTHTPQNFVTFGVGWSVERFKVLVQPSTLFNQPTSNIQPNQNICRGSLLPH